MSESSLIGRRILVVEDEPMIVMLIESLLEELGCIVADVAAKPASALQIIGSTGIDAAILDVNLNGVDSFGIANVLAERRIPFVFATGYGGSRLPPEFAGRPVLQKPYRIEELAQALEAAFDRPSAAV
jgi:CheY-like chemotaxis protein